MAFLQKYKNQNISNNYTNIIQWNVRSLPARLPSLQHLLSDHKCSIALLSETWLLPSRALTMPQFKIYRSDRSDGYGGVAIAAHNSFKSKLIPLDIATRNRFTHCKIDIIGIEVHLINSHPPLKFWSCYIPSSSNVPSNLWHEFFNLISHNTLLGGDFNAFHPAWGSQLAFRRGSQIYDCINSFGLCSLNDGSPTHVGRPNSTNSAIDLSFCSPDIIWYLSWQVLNDPHGSDHIPIIITANFNRITDPVPSCSALDSSPSIYLPFNFNKANWSSYSLQIHNSISSVTNSSSPVFSYSTFTSIISNSADSTIPKKRLNTNPYPPSPPWWNSDCTEAVKNRTLLFRNFRRSGSMSDFINYRNACAQTTRLLKNEKRKKWKKFCSNLNPSFPIHHLWSTAKRYKNCINPVRPPDNDDWFDSFCFKVAPCYVPSKSEVCPSDHSLHSPPHVLTNIFTMSELNLAISSRKSTASGLDNISPIMLKHLPSNALVYLLSIMNNILSSNQVPPSWTSYRVIPIPKPNSNVSFRPIALSSSLCKVFEYMLKTRLDWWLESNSVLPANLFAFRKGLGTMECLSTFIGNIYHAFNNKEFLVATFVDIRGAFDSVNIPTLITYLLSLNVPPKFCNVLSALFNFRNLVFFSPFGSSNTRSTFTDLPQGSCLSPILFNV